MLLAIRFISVAPPTLSISAYLHSAVCFSSVSSRFAGSGALPLTNWDSSDMAVIKDKSKVTPFQARVYKTISDIPAGKVSTYGGVAEALDSSARAVGGALRRNPFAPVVPCHRVVMGDLSIGGFSGSFGDCADTRRKRKMLEEEGVSFLKDKVDGSAYVYKFPRPSEAKGFQQKKKAEGATAGTTAKRALPATKTRDTVKNADKRSRRVG